MAEQFTNMCGQAAQDMGISDLEKAPDTRKLKVYKRVLKQIFDALVGSDLDKLPLASLQGLATGLCETIEFFYSIRTRKLGERFDTASITAIIRELDKASACLSCALSLLRDLISINPKHPGPRPKIFFEDIHTGRECLFNVILLLGAF